MSNLSQPMRDVIMAATNEGLLTVGAARTVTALKTRGLVDDSGLNLTDAGKAVRAELIAPDQGDVNPTPTTNDVTAMVGNPVEWVNSTLTASDERIAEYLATEGEVCNDPTCWACAPEDSADDTEIPSEGDTGIDPVNAAQGVSDAPEDTREAVPGLEKLLDTPHVVPNRKDKRNRKRIIRAFNRLFARKRDEQTKKRTDAAKAARKRGRKVAA
jgi:hypothetical protein